MKRYGKALLGGGLTAVWVWFFCLGRVGRPAFYALAAGAAAFLLLGGHSHSHGQMTLDDHARRSGLADENAGLKVAFSVALLLLCVGADSMGVSLAVLLLCGALVVGLGKTSVHTYFSFLLLPLVFILVSGIVLMAEWSSAAMGVWALPLGSHFLCITPAGQQNAMEVSMRAMGAVSCLYLLSFTTPFYEIIEVLRKLHLPQVILELMVLIYRYIFILLAVQEERTTAAEARFGYRTLKTGFRTFGKVSAGLMIHAFRRASRAFDAMEARCYDGRIAYLTKEKPLRAFHAAAAAMLFLSVAALAWF